MDILSSSIHKLKNHLESAAFLVSKGGAEREAHGEIVNSIVILSKIEYDLERLTQDDSLKDRFASSSDSQSKESVMTSTSKKNEVDEIEKVKRKVPKWFKNPSQDNSTILLNFLKLSKNNSRVTVQMLRQNCPSMKGFDGSYNQMKNFGKKNNGKTFEEIDGYIILWAPVKEFILDLYGK